MDDNFQIFDGVNSHYKLTSSPVVLGGSALKGTRMRTLALISTSISVESVPIFSRWDHLWRSHLPPGPSYRVSPHWSLSQLAFKFDLPSKAYQISFFTEGKRGEVLRSVLTQGKSGKSWNKTCGLPLLLLLGLRTSPCYVLSFCSSQMINL